MSVIITNISTHDDLKGNNQYVLKINNRIISYFDHTRSEGLSECLRKAADSVPIENENTFRGRL